MTTLADLCMVVDPTDTTTAYLEYAACGLPAGHQGGHRWQPCGAEIVVPFEEGGVGGQVVITCSRKGHAGTRHALEWEAKS